MKKKKTIVFNAAAWKQNDSIHIIPAILLQYEFMRGDGFIGNNRKIYILTIDFVWLCFNTYASVRLVRNIKKTEL